ncbi:cytochrome P450, partial [Rhizoctonia solani]
MSETNLDFDQAQWLLNKAAEFIQTHPLESSIALAFASVGGYAVKKLIAPSNYPNIDGPPNDDINIVFGHFIKLNTPDAIPFHDELQDKYGSVCKLKGILGKEELFVSDPRFLHEVLVKGVDTTFSHEQYFYDFNAATLGPGLLSTYGNIHKVQRKMLNPVFTSKHMKSLVSVFGAIARNTKYSMIKEMGDSGKKEMDMLRWCGATALELIGQAGLGHTFGILEQGDSAYSLAIKDFFPAFVKIIPLKALIPFFCHLRPKVLQRKLAEWAPVPSVQRLRHIVKVQDDQAQSILELKKDRLKSGQAGDGEELHDIMSILLKANMEASEKDRLPEDQLLGQMNTLILAGHETTSGSLTRLLQLLAMNQAIQDRLRAELLGASEQLTYDELQGLPYLDAICREALRLYPPFALLEREALADCTIPLRYPIKGKNGDEIREIRVRKGTVVHAAIGQANRSKETWGEDADVFRPERWLEKLPDSVSDSKTAGVYSSLMTFSAGPRSCIGFKFAVLELKTVLSTLVKSFKFEPGSTKAVWLMAGSMLPYVEGTKDLLGEGIRPAMPLVVSVL